MAAATGYTVTTTGTGGSDHIVLPPSGWYSLDVVWAGSAGDADLQSSGNASDWIDAEDSSGAINITADKSVIVPGGRSWRLDVNTHTSAATMTAHKVSNSE